MKTWWNRLKAWALNIWHQLDNWQTLVLFGVVTAILYSPVWGGYLLYVLFHWKWAFYMASGVALFWAGPFTPFFPLCVSVTLLIKEWWLHLTHPKS